MSKSLHEGLDDLHRALAEFMGEIYTVFRIPQIAYRLEGILQRFSRF